MFLRSLKRRFIVQKICYKTPENDNEASYWRLTDLKTHFNVYFLGLFSHVLRRTSCNLVEICFLNVKSAFSTCFNATFKWNVPSCFITYLFKTSVCGSNTLNIKSKKKKKRCYDRQDRATGDLGSRAEAWLTGAFSQSGGRDRRRRTNRVRPQCSVWALIQADSSVISGSSIHWDAEDKAGRVSPLLGKRFFWPSSSSLLLLLLVDTGKVEIQLIF